MTGDATREAAAYEFGPPETGAIALGLSPAQLSIVMATLLAAVSAAWAGVPLPLVGLFAAPAVAFGALRLGPQGDRLTTLAVRWAGWSLRPRSGRTSRLTTSAPAPGQDGDVRPAEVPPPGWARGLELVEVPYGDASIGLWYDAGSWVVVLDVSAPAIALRDLDEQEGLLSRWGDIMASAGVEGSILERIGWLVRAVPDRGADAAQHLRESGTVPLALNNPVLRSYLDAVDRAGTTAAARQLLLTIRVRPDRAPHRLRKAGRDKEARRALAAELAICEAEHVGSRLVELGCEPGQVYTAEGLAALARCAFDPTALGDLALWRGATGDPDAGVDPATGMWPLTWEEAADHVRTDGGFHRVYWIEGWPTVPVGATWMQPLLLRTTVQRTVAMVMEPEAIVRSERVARRTRAAAISHETERERRGFLATARGERVISATEQRERELVEGHREMLYAGWVVVSATSLDELEDGCATTISEAALSRLRLRPLHGEHWPALVAALPVGRFV